MAAAKACGEERKRTRPPERRSADPARYALAEVVNNHDDALAFAPIHRCLFGVDPQAVTEALLAYYPGAHWGTGAGHTIRCVWAGGSGAIAFLRPAMGKEQLFKTVMADGVLPRKTFSMGHARDKRYYVEARKIR